MNILTLEQTEEAADRWLEGLRCAATVHEEAYGGSNLSEEQLAEARRYFFAAGYHDHRL